ncbi:MAG: hypothetical protein ABH858_03225 [Candidatus Omnitrophota bacterium]
MANNVKKIIDYVKARSFLKNLSEARLKMTLMNQGINLDSIKDSPSIDPELEKKVIDAAKEILKVDRIDIS